MKQTEQLQAIATAIQAVTSDLELDIVLQQIVEASRRLVRARYAALGVLNEAGDAIEQFITAGMEDAARHQIGDYPQGRGLLGHIIQQRQPLRVADMRHDSRAVGFPAHHPLMTSLLGVPIISKGHVFGNLYLTDKVASEQMLDVDIADLEALPFTVEDQELVELFARQAAIAIENALLHRQRRQLAIAQERERFAMDLHDGIIQSIYGVGLALDESRYQLDQDRELTRQGINQAIASLNDVIIDIRSYILNLRARRLADEDLAAGLDRLSQELRAYSFLSVTLDLDDAVLDRVSDAQAHELLHIVQEALANVRKHAGATTVVVRLSRVEENIVLCVEDNGFGLSASEVESRKLGDGLSNMRARAQAIGGTLTVRSGPLQGTSVTVTVPTSAPDAPKFR